MSDVVNNPIERSADPIEAAFRSQNIDFKSTDVAIDTVAKNLISQHVYALMQPSIQETSGEIEEWEASRASLPQEEWTSDDWDMSKHRQDRDRRLKNLPKALEAYKEIHGAARLTQTDPPPSYLLQGPPGEGKSTTIVEASKIVAKALGRTWTRDVHALSVKQLQSDRYYVLAELLPAGKHNVQETTGIQGSKNLNDGTKDGIKVSTTLMDEVLMKVKEAGLSCLNLDDILNTPAHVVDALMPLLLPDTRSINNVSFRMLATVLSANMGSIDATNADVLSPAGKGRVKIMGVIDTQENWLARAHARFDAVSMAADIMEMWFRDYPGNFRILDSNEKLGKEPNPRNNTLFLGSLSEILENCDNDLDRAMDDIAMAFKHSLNPEIYDRDFAPFFDALRNNSAYLVRQIIETGTLSMEKKKRFVWGKETEISDNELMWKSFEHPVTKASFQYQFESLLGGSTASVASRLFHERLAELRKEKRLDEIHDPAERAKLDKELILDAQVSMIPAFENLAKGVEALAKAKSRAEGTGMEHDILQTMISPIMSSLRRSLVARAPEMADAGTAVNKKAGKHAQVHMSYEPAVQIAVSIKSTLATPSVGRVPMDENMLDAVVDEVIGGLTGMSESKYGQNAAMKAMFEVAKKNQEAFESKDERALGAKSKKATKKEPE